MVLWSGKTYSRASVGALHAHTDNIYIFVLLVYIKYFCLICSLQTAETQNFVFSVGVE